MKNSITNRFAPKVLLPTVLAAATAISLNGHDAGTYDLPGSFWAVTAKYGF